MNELLFLILWIPGSYLFCYLVIRLFKYLEPCGYKKVRESFLIMLGFAPLIVPVVAFAAMLLKITIIHLIILVTYIFESVFGKGVINSLVTRLKL